ncbi:MAG TPA: glycoside hydrolase family 2 TIM barrel-domain containing protein [Cyclobacteriaceae bacterium]|nr:glycoside hydrolase family 2 TIM barrel-domain containing protein [Cyclobacteriaceae bacterium]
MRRSIVFILSLFILTHCRTGQDRIRDKLRESVSFNEDWYFMADSIREGLAKGWPMMKLPLARPVKVPHTWNVDTDLEEYYGWGWYQKNFRVPLEWKNSMVKLAFNSIYRDVVIWINGQKLLERKGSGYTPFELRIDGNINFDSLNNITILVNNSYSRLAMPMYSSFDWPNDGGLIRNIKLIKSAPVSFRYVLINPTYDNSGNGIARIALILESMDGEINDNIDLWYNVVHSGKEIVKGNRKIAIAGNRGELSIEIPGIILWHFNDPSLYNLNIAIGKDYLLTDHYGARFGFRKFETEGIRLLFNGEAVRLPGLEWMPGSDIVSGMAEDTASSQKMLSLLKNTGAVITRFHWPQDESILDWCDRNGLLVQEELPLWARPFPEDIDDSLRSVISTQLKEMVISHYNHPSVIAWGIGNELQANNPEIIDFLNALKKEVLAIDTSRLVNYVSNTLHGSPGSDGTDVGDILMWNDYTGLWYSLGERPVKDEDLGMILSGINKMNPAKPLIISEYGLCEPFFEGGDPRRISHLIYHTSVYDTLDFIAGAIYFSLNDYRTHMGEEGKGRLRRRIHGVVDLSGNPKPSYETLKEIFNPLKDVRVNVINGKLHVTGVNHDGLPSYAIKGFKAILKDYRSGTTIELVNMPVLMPGDKFNISFSGQAGGAYSIHIFAPNERELIRTDIVVEK